MAKEKKNVLETEVIQTHVYSNKNILKPRINRKGSNLERIEKKNYNKK